LSGIGKEADWTKENFMALKHFQKYPSHGRVTGEGGDFSRLWFGEFNKENPKMQECKTCMRISFAVERKKRKAGY
jgi:hypothetical protein